MGGDLITRGDKRQNARWGMILSIDEGLRGVDREARRMDLRWLQAASISGGQITGRAASEALGLAHFVSAGGDWL